MSASALQQCRLLRQLLRLSAARHLTQSPSSWLTVAQSHAPCWGQPAPAHMAASRAAVRVLRLAGMPILQQLQLEEALLRATPHNWFIVNDGCSQASIVMGISG